MRKNLFSLRTLKPWIFGCVASLALYSAAFGGSGWNVVVKLTLDDNLLNMLRYNPDKGPAPQKVYASEDACKAVIDGDAGFAAALQQLKDGLKDSVPAGHSVKIEAGCMEVDAEPESF